MSKPYYFDMRERCIGDQLPGERAEYEYDENLGLYRVLIHGGEELWSIPLRLDMAIGHNVLVSDAQHNSIYRNGHGYIAEYHAYAVHVFDETIPY